MGSGKRAVSVFRVVATGHTAGDESSRLDGPAPQTTQDGARVIRSWAIKRTRTGRPRRCCMRSPTSSTAWRPTPGIRSSSMTMLLRDPPRWHLRRVVVAPRPRASVRPAGARELFERCVTNEAAAQGLGDEDRMTLTLTSDVGGDRAARAELDWRLDAVRGAR